MGQARSVYLYQVATKPGLTAAEFPLLRKHVESEVGPVYWIVDKIAHDAKAAREGNPDHEKCIPADWLATPGVDCFAFYSTFSNFRRARIRRPRRQIPLHDEARPRCGKEDAPAGPPRTRQLPLRRSPLRDAAPRWSNAPRLSPRATDAGADYLMVTVGTNGPSPPSSSPPSSWPDPYHYLKILAEWKGIPSPRRRSLALQRRQP